MNDEKPTDQKTKTYNRVLGFLAGLAILALLVGAIIGGIMFNYLKPSHELAQTFDMSELGKNHKASTLVAFDDVPKHTINAIIASEDPEFYSHQGVNLKGIARVCYSNFREQTPARGDSTIARQVARTNFSIRGRGINQQITFLFLARRVEKHLGKKEVLELYINQLYFGSGYYGIHAAAEGFYGKVPSDLTVAESATLAGLIRNPYYRSPRRYPDTCKRSRHIVLKAMREHGFIDTKTMNAAILEPLKVIPKAETVLNDEELP